MRRAFSCIMAALLALGLAPARAFASPQSAPAASPERSASAALTAEAAPRFSIAYAGYDEGTRHDGATYCFSVTASAPVIENTVIAYTTFLGTTEEGWFIPERSSVTMEAGQSAVEVDIAAAEPASDAVDSYVADGGAKYFGVALLGASAGSIDKEHQAATAAVEGAPHAVADTTGLVDSQAGGTFLQALCLQGDLDPWHSVEESLEMARFSYNADTGKGTWLLAPADLTYPIALDIDNLRDSQLASGSQGRLDPYFFAAGGLQFVYQLDYVLSSDDRFGMYDAGDVETSLQFTDAAGATSFAADASLEAWRSGAFSTVDNSWSEDTLSVNVPNVPTSQTVADASGRPGVDWRGADELIGGYYPDSVMKGQTVDIAGQTYLVSDVPLALQGQLNVKVVNPQKGYSYEGDPRTLNESDFAYSYKMTMPTATYGVVDERPPAPRASGAVFSQAQYETGDTVRVSVPFDEIVTAAPQAATLSIGTSGQTMELTLAGGVGTNVLEYTGAYDGRGAATTPDALNCTLTLAAGLEDLAGNATAAPVAAPCQAAFREHAERIVPRAPQVSAHDASGNSVPNDGTATSDVTVTFSQPADDTAKSAVVAYEVTTDNGTTFTRVPVEGGETPQASMTVQAKGMHTVAARAVAVGDVSGPLSAPLTFVRYDEGETPGVISLSADENAGTFTVTREGGSAGKQTVTVRDFNGSTGASHPLNLSKETFVFEAGEEGSKTGTFERSGAEGYKEALEGYTLHAGIEIATVTSPEGMPTAEVAPEASSVLVKRATSHVSTTGIYKDDGNGNPLVPAGSQLEATRDLGDGVFLAPGEVDEHSVPLHFTASGKSVMDVYYRYGFNMSRDTWSFAGMYDVNATLSFRGTTLFHGWEDYDNVGNNSGVVLPGTSLFNNTETPGDVRNRTYVYAGTTYNDAQMFYLADVKDEESLGKLRLESDDRLGKDCSLNVDGVYAEGFAIDKQAPYLTHVELAPDTFYPGNEVRVYLNFSEYVTAADVTVNIYDQNRTVCYASLQASGPRAAGTTDDQLVGIGGRYGLMASGFLDEGQVGLPESVLVEVEATNVSDCVGNMGASSKTSLCPADSAADPVPPTTPDGPGYVDPETFGSFTLAAKGANEFVIGRQGGTTGRQQVYFRTLFGTNDPMNPYFEPVDSSVVFEEGQTEAVVVVQPRKADREGVGCYSDAGVKRQYGMQLYAVVGGGALANADALFVPIDYDDDLWSVDLASYLYAEGLPNVFQRTAYTPDSTHKFVTDYADDRNKYFFVTPAPQVYSQVHAYQNKKHFIITANDVTTTLKVKDTDQLLYSGHEDFDNTNKDSCYFPESVPINSGNTVDDSAFTCSVAGSNIDGRGIGRVYRLSLKDTVMKYQTTGFTDDLEVKDAWLDYLFVDSRAPQVTGFYPGAASLVPGGQFAVSVRFDELVFSDDARLELYTADRNTLLGQVGCTLGSGTNVLSFVGDVPSGYQGGSYALKLVGNVTDKSGNRLDTTDASCQTTVTTTDASVVPPSISLNTEGANTYDVGGVTYYNRATASIVPGDTGAASYYSLDGVTFVQGDSVALEGESAACRVWAKSVKGDHESAVVVSEPLAIDTLGPRLNPQVEDGWVNNRATVNTNVLDEGVGAANIDVTPSGGVVVADDLQSLTVSENGHYELRATDALGNVGAAVSVDVQTIDKEAPPAPTIYSAGEEVALTQVSSELDSYWAGELTKSPLISFEADHTHDVLSAERYAYAYPYWCYQESVNKWYTTEKTPWIEGAPLSVVCEWNGPQGLYTNLNVGVYLRGRSVKVYAEDEANSRELLYAFDCSKIEKGTNVYVTPYVLDDPAAVPTSSYDGSWTAGSVAFVLQPEIVEEEGAAPDGTARITNIQYSTNNGATWTDVTDAGAGCTWKPAEASSLDRGGMLSVAGDQDASYCFRALALGGGVMQGLNIAAPAGGEPAPYEPHASEAYPVRIDTTCPDVDASVFDASAPSQPLSLEPQTFSQGPLTVKLLSTDYGASGVSFEARVLDGDGDAPWLPVQDDDEGTPNTAAFTVSVEGCTNFEVRAVSGAGVTSEPVAFQTKLDKTPPRVTAVEYSPMNNGETRITFTITDALPDETVEVSGAHWLWYRSVTSPGGGGNPTGVKIEGPTMDISIAADKTGLLEYWVEDYAGNESEHASVPLHGVSLGDVSTEPATGPEAWTKEHEITVNAGIVFTNTNADLAEVRCGADPGGAGSVALTLADDKHSASGEVRVETGVTTLYVWAEDTSHNKSSLRTIDVYCDGKPPTLSVKGTGAGGGSASQPATSMTFAYQTQDAHSGPASVTYAVDGGAPVQMPASGSVDVDAEGVYDVVFTAYDKAGNASTKTFRISIDRGAPQVAGVTYRPQTVQPFGVDAVIATEDSLAASGTGSGTDALELEFYNAAGEQVGGVQRRSVQGEQALVQCGPADEGTVKVTPIDKAGNRGQQVVVHRRGVDVDDVAAAPATSPDAWTAESVELTARIADHAGEGVDEVFLSTQPAQQSGTPMEYDPSTGIARTTVRPDQATTYYLNARAAGGTYGVERAVTVYADTAQPMVTAALSTVDGPVPFDPQMFCARPVDVLLTTGAQTSGVAFKVREQGGVWKRVEAQEGGLTARFTIRDEGIHKFEVCTESGAGLQSPVVSFTTKIDTTAPQVTDVSYRPGRELPGGRRMTEVVFTCADAGPSPTTATSGIQRFEYRFEAASGVSAEVHQVAVGGDGTVAVEVPPDVRGQLFYRVIDQAGNASAEAAVAAHSLAVGAPIVAPQTGPDSWTNAPALFVEVPVRAQGGEAIEKVFVTTDPTASDGDGLALDAGGLVARGTVSPLVKTTYYVRARDDMGNLSAARAFTVFADRIVPALDVEPRERGTSSVWFPSVTFDVQATDADSGLAELTYTEAGQVKRLSGASFTVTEEGSYLVSVCARDRAGNETTATYEVHVVEAAVAEVVNAIALLPSPDAPQAAITAQREVIMRTVQSYMALDAAQKAKVPDESLMRLEDIYARIVPLVIHRTDDASGITLMGLAFALDLPELDQPGAIVELQVRTRDLEEGGLSLAQLRDAAQQNAYELLYAWDVVVEKRVVVGDQVSTEIVGAEQWLEGAHIRARFPLPDSLEARPDLRLVNLTSDSVTEVPSWVEDGAIVGSLEHLSYYGLALPNDAPVPPPLPTETGTLLPTGDGSASIAGGLGLLALVAVVAAAVSVRKRPPSRNSKR